MAVTPEELEAAKKKYYAIISGTAAEEFVDQNGERVEFTRANAAALLAWINANDPTLTTVYPYRPMGFLF